MSKILIVMSAADTWRCTDGSNYPTGYWAEEVAAPHGVFADAGYEMDFASPGGVLQPLDAHSADPAAAGQGCERYVTYAQAVLHGYGPLLTLSEVRLADYDAIVLPGGHGPVVDLCEDPKLGRLLREADAAKAVVGAVCHWPAGLLAAVDDHGDWLYSGRRMTAFTNEEEELFGTAEGAPWLLATTLAERGATLSSGAAYQEFTVSDVTLFTGQNPASSAAMAREMVAHLQQRS